MASLQLKPDSTGSDQPSSSALGTSHLSALGSGVRQVSDHEQQRRRAHQRVIEYLRAQGLDDPQRLEQLAHTFVQAHSDASETPALIADVMDDVQQRWSHFANDVFDDPTRLDPIWMRSFIAAHPDLCLGDVALARQAALRFGDATRGELPRAGQVIEQRFGALRLQPWLKGLAIPLCITVVLTALAAHELAQNGLSALELLWSLCFAAVFLLPATGAAIAWLGFTARRRDALRVNDANHVNRVNEENVADANVEPASSVQAGSDRCAVLLPIFHEQAEPVFAAIAAMRESLEQTALAARVEIFVLSDSRDPLCAADEERAFRRVAALPHTTIPIYYRRRAHNTRQKAGNLADFFERFGARYRYAVILDADSLMSGQAIEQLVTRMDAAPQVALIQAGLQLHGGHTLLARTQQWIASVCGPLMMRGLARWSGSHGNYYGHNAIVRVAAFMQCCGLPQLSGAPPFGGHFLSHDFVEAALLTRAGWQVRSAWDIAESWEQMPQALPDYVARDRRWCQGNLQHLRILLADGLQPMSRIHLAIGVLSYVAAPLLLVFLALTALLAVTQQSALSRGLSITLISTAFVCLLTPRALAFIEVASDRTRRAQHGGLVRLVWSMVLDVALSAWLAPLFLLHHTTNVLSIALGRAVGWSTQNRSARSAHAALLRLEMPATCFGAVLLFVTWQLAPRLVLWLAPLWLPCLLSIPLSWLVSTPVLGWLSRRVGLFATAPELAPHPLFARVRELRASTVSHVAARFRDLVLDPVLLATHLKHLSASQRPRASQAELDAAYARAVRLGPAALSAAECALLESSAEMLPRLHAEAWRRWPVEAWDLGRAERQLPEDPSAAISA